MVQPNKLIKVNTNKHFTMLDNYFECIFYNHMQK